MIISRISLIIWKALTPYINIYFSALIIEELSGSRDMERIRFLILAALLSAAGISLVSALFEKWKNTQSARIGLKIKHILCEKFLDMDYVDLDDTRTMDLYNTIIQNLNGQGWGLYHVLENYEDLCSGVLTILGGFALTFSLFTSPHIRFTTILRRSFQPAIIRILLRKRPQPFLQALIEGIHIIESIIFISQNNRFFFTL